MSRGDRDKRASPVEWAFPLTGLTVALGIACIGIEPARVFECVVEKVESSTQAAHDAQDLEAQEQAAWSAIAGAIFAFAALLATVRGLIWIKGTLDATWEGLKQSRKTAALERRPIMVFDELEITCRQSGNNVAQVRWKNIGRSPATISEMKCTSLVCNAFHSYSRKLESFFDGEGVDKVWLTRPNWQILPNATVKMGFNKFSDGDIINLPVGLDGYQPHGLFILARIEYRSTFGDDDELYSSQIRVSLQPERDDLRPNPKTEVLVHPDGTELR